jgi:hypothetical protein
MIQIESQHAPPGVLHAVRIAHAGRRSADQRKCGRDFIAYAIGDDRFALTIGDAAAKRDRGRRIADSSAAAGVEGGLLFGRRSPHVHLGATGPLLGIAERSQFQERSMQFLPGDVLVAYTDGVTEARGRAGAPPFGSSGLVRSMRELYPGEPSIRALWNKIGRYTGRVYHDGATLAIVTAAFGNTR